jgi:predicted  nucleic acid-binding Zn-ribbon protein
MKMRTSVRLGGRVTVRDQLAGYIALQRLLDRKATLMREQEVPPEELANLRARSAERDEKLGTHRVRQEGLSTEHSTLQRELEALREEREHFRKQKSQVTNMKQLTAVVSELDHVETQIKTKEERLFEILQEVETVEREMSSQGAETPEERTAREQAEAAWEERRKKANAELLVVRQELAATQHGLGGSAMEQFKKLWLSRKPNAVVPLEGSSCSACHADLRPSLVQQVRTLEELACCDYCRRLLYDPDHFSA